MDYLSDKSFEAIFELDYLHARAHLLEAAACLDRFARYDKANIRLQWPAYQNLQKGLMILNDALPQKTERFLEAFSCGLEKESLENHENY